MSCHRITVDDKGKPSGDPTMFSDNRMVGQWAVRAYQQSWDGKSVISYTFDGFKVTKGNAVSEYKVQMLWKNLWWSPYNQKFVIWLPSRDQFLLQLRQPITNPSTKKVLKGLYLVHADKKGAKESDLLELVTDAIDTHTVYFSRKGKYICWATPEAIYYRETAKQ